MIDGKTISVLITTYHPGRFETIGKVCEAWLEQPADQVWLIDGGAELQHAQEDAGYPSDSDAYGAVGRPGSFDMWGRIDDPRFLYWPLPRDFGTRTDYALTALTEGDFICLADDDVLPKLGFLNDLYAGWQKSWALSVCDGAGGQEPVDEPIVGVMGRRFKGPDYQRNTAPQYRSSKVEAPQRVGFVGVVCFSPRQHFGFDTRGMHRNVDDLKWQMECKPDVPKWVVPTTAYENLPECKDSTAMWRNRSLKQVRNEFYRKWYETNYGPHGRTY